MRLKTSAASAVRFARHIAILIVPLLIVASLACAQSKSKNAAAPADTPGELRHYNITVADLPPPEVQRGPLNPSRLIPKPTDAKLTVPPGFEVSTYAEGNFDRPRWLALAPNGDVFVAESEGKRISILRDANGDGTVDQRFIFAEGLNAPFGMAFWKDYLYVGNNNAVIRFKYKAGQTKAEGAPEKVADLPGNGYREHWTRNLIFSPDGSKLYVTVGSKTNVDAGEEPMRAAISEFNPDGTGQRIFASGTRNPIGLDWNPRTRQLWAAVQERDLIGNDLVPDYVTSITDGAFYGWPYAYIGPREDPRRKGEQPGLVQKTLVPDVLIQAHSAVLGMVFYQGKMFPEAYRGDAFVALHGSWNREPRTGYKIVRIRFDKSGKPVGGYDDFLTGWMLGPDRPEVWGRPVGLLVLKDGSLLIADDGAMKIWRVTYRKPK
ncbi:MAG TPA: sorbosone dehydrogenase family protein [Blastocatellia bacterium]|nr:sorbosone dehydrogenase family protein [Blastocatellia bacterium]